MGNTDKGPPKGDESVFERAMSILEQAEKEPAAKAGAEPEANTEEGEGTETVAPVVDDEEGAATLEEVQGQPTITEEALGELTEDELNDLQEIGAKAADVQKYMKISKDLRGQVIALAKSAVKTKKEEEAKEAAAPSGPDWGKFETDIIPHLNKTLTRELKDEDLAGFATASALDPAVVRGLASAVQRATIAPIAEAVAKLVVSAFQQQRALAETQRQSAAYAARGRLEKSFPELEDDDKFYGLLEDPATTKLIEGNIEAKMSVAKAVEKAVRERAKAKFGSKVPPKGAQTGPRVGASKTGVSPRNPASPPKVRVTPKVGQQEVRDLDAIHNAAYDAFEKQMAVEAAKARKR